MSCVVCGHCLATREGVSCHCCATTTSGEQQARFQARQKQMTLAADRGVVHLGSDTITTQMATPRVAVQSAKLISRGKDTDPLNE